MTYCNDISLERPECPETFQLAFLQNQNGSQYAPILVPVFALDFRSAALSSI